MRKATAIVIYKGTTLYNLTIEHKGARITLLSCDNDLQREIYTFSTFSQLYYKVLGLCKGNNFKIDSYLQFGKNWYDISFIDLDKPYKVEKFGL